jgi:NADP-dependent 3-hydroxy acid dehydrogenase YdfG
MAFPSPTKTYHSSAYPAIDPCLPALSSKGKHVVITGGGSGIGSEIAKAFAQSGAANIALLGRTEESLLRTKQVIEAEYNATKVSTYVADIVDTTALEHSLTIHAQTYGKFHILVANAGFLPSNQSLVETSSEDWYTVSRSTSKATSIWYAPSYLMQSRML